MRHDDHDNKSFFRSTDRVFHMNGQWYFATREGDEGPYGSEVLARQEIRRFIAEKTELAQFQKAREEEHDRAAQAAIEAAKEKRAPSVPSLGVLPTADRPRTHIHTPHLSRRKVHI